MSRNYDNWEKLVGAVLRRERDRQLVYCPSFSTCYSADLSSRSSFDSVIEDADHFRDVHLPTGNSIDEQMDESRLSNWDVGFQPLNDMMSGMSRSGDSFPFRGIGGRNRGRDGYSSSHILVQNAREKLIFQDISNISGKTPEIGNTYYNEFQEFLKQKSIQNDSSSSKANPFSYANIAGEEDDSHLYIGKNHKDIIHLCEEIDKQWKDGPWHILKRYFSTGYFAHGSYKPRGYYESILTATASVEFKHFNGVNTPAGEYNFSKAIIKRIISFEEWGLSPLAEREVINELQPQVKYKFNYWDYVESFHKAFLCENIKKKHTWFFKICDKVFLKPLPNWVFTWWRSFGPTSKVLPEIYKNFFEEWIKYSPLTQKSETKIDEKYCCQFFIQFSIPWIWKWKPEFGYTDINAPCIFCKFWEKMINLDPETQQIFSQDTILHMGRIIQSYKKDYKSKEEENNPSSLKKLFQKYFGICSEARVIFRGNQKRSTGKISREAKNLNI